MDKNLVYDLLTLLGGYRALYNKHRPPEDWCDTHRLLIEHTLERLKEMEKGFETKELK